MKMLFICTHNACRSILSEAITRRMAGGRIATASAGISPRGHVHPLTLEYLGKHGYDCEGLSSKSMDSLRDFAPDIVVTVCDSAANEACPVWLGNCVKVHWGLPDPTRAGVTDVAAAFAGVIATIEERTARLLEQPFETMTTAQLTNLMNKIGSQS
jgi:arsenate reductase